MTDTATAPVASTSVAESVQKFIVPTGTAKTVDLSEIQTGATATKSTLSLGPLYTFYIGAILKIAAADLAKMVMRWKLIRENFAVKQMGQRGDNLIVDGFIMKPGTNLTDMELNDRRFGALLGVHLIMSPEKQTGDLLLGPPMYQSMPENIKTFMKDLKFSMVNGCHLMYKMYRNGNQTTGTEDEKKFAAAVGDNGHLLFSATVFVDWLTYCRTPVDGKVINIGTNLKTFMNNIHPTMRGATFGLLSNNNAVRASDLGISDAGAKEMWKIFDARGTVLPGKTAGNRTRYNDVVKGTKPVAS